MMKRALLVFFFLSFLSTNAYTADTYNQGWEEGKSLSNQIGKDLSDPNTMMDKLGKPLFDKQEKMTPLNGQDTVYECSSSNPYNGKTFKTLTDCNAKCSPGTCHLGFTAQIQEPSTHCFLDVQASVAANGSMTFTARQDLDMDGTFDHTYTPSQPVTVLCTAGYLSCPPGPYVAATCSAYKWEATGGVIQEVLQAPGDMTALGSCHCITTDCGYTMAGDGARHALEDLGSGLSVTITSQGDSRFSISKVISDPVSMRISYNGQKANLGGTTAFSYTGGITNPEIYQNNASGLTTASQNEMASQSGDPHSLGYLVDNSPAMSSKSFSTYSCQIKKDITVETIDVTHYCFASYTTPTISNTNVGYAHEYNALVTSHGWEDYCPDHHNGAGGAHTLCETYGYTVTVACPGGTPPPGAFRVGSVECANTYVVWSSGGHDSLSCSADITYGYPAKEDNPPNILTTGSCSPASGCTLRNEQVCDQNGNNCIYTIQNGLATNVTVPARCMTVTTEVSDYSVCSMGSKFNVVKQVDGAVFNPSDGEPDYFIVKRTYSCQGGDDGIDLTDAKRQAKAIHDSTTISDAGVLSYSATNRAYDPITKTFGAVTTDSNSKSIGSDTIKEPVNGQVCRVSVPSQRTDVNASVAASDLLVTSSMSEVAVRTCTQNSSGIWVCPYDAGKGETIKKDCSVDSMFNEGMSTLNALDEARKNAICAKPPE